MTYGAAGPWSRRRAALVALALAAVLAASWWATHPTRPLHPTGDLYGHLATARHLVRGEGFRTDLAYPLSFAWEFARELPQPLLHRGPGFAVLLTIPHAAAGGDPVRTLAAVRVMQLALLAGIGLLGSYAWLRRGRPAAATGWLVLLGANPLLGFAVDWGFVELATALVLLAVWLRRRDGTTGLGWRDGLGPGLLALLRPELAGVPILWWLLDWRGPRPRARRLAAPALVFLVLAAPWAVRNLVLAGDPFFSVQAHAEHLKDTTHLPGYAVYRGLEPRSLPATLADDPLPVLKKTWRGLDFYRREGKDLVPWLLLAPALLGAFVLVRARLYARIGGDGEPPPDLATGPGVAGVTVVLLAALYAVYDHSLRHLVVMIPVLLWEAGPFLADLPAEVVPAWFGRTDSRAVPLVRRTWFKAPAAALAAGLLVLVMGATPAGWNEAAREAARRRPEVERETRRLREAPPGVVFVATSAAPWFADRPAVWDPGDETVRATIRRYLEDRTP